MTEFKLSEQALSILKKRYFLPGEDWEGLCKRTSSFLAKDEKERSAFFDIMHNGIFLPNSPTLMNAGLPDAQMSACFLLTIEDSMKDIFGTLQDAARIFQTGGGVGFRLDLLRPEGFKVKNVIGASSGPISFLKVYDAAIQEIKQSRRRRGAAIGTMRVTHPDIVKFIKCKHVDNKISNFNISVLLTDEFMDCLEKEESAWRCEFNSKYYVINKKTDTPFLYEEWDGDMDKVYTSYDIWNLICEQAHRNGEPGVAFWAEIIRKNGKEIEGLNPCVTGDMLVYVADGRGCVPISNLVQEGKDVNVVCLNGENKPSIRMMRSPRITGYKQPIKKITLRDGTILKVTPNHKFLTTKCKYTEAKDLIPGVSLKVLSKSKNSKEYNKLYYDGNTVSEHRLFALLDKYTGSNSPFQKYTDLQKEAGDNNNIIVSVEDCGLEDVYSGTVDDFHNFFITDIKNSNFKNQRFFNNLNCGEQPLERWGVCCLGSIDISKFYNHHHNTDVPTFDKIDWSNLGKTVETAVDFLNRVLDKNTYPLPQITEQAKKTRKIGLGIMGWADLLLKLGIRYGSDESLEFAEKLMKFINDWAHDHSEKQDYRNKTLTTIAPTGSLSLLVSTSSGIEPNFGWKTIHNREQFGKTEVIHPLASQYGLDNLPDYFVTADQISPEEHIKMVAAFQKHVDNGISKTILLPEDATVEDVKRAYLLAYKMKCKGITVYRDGSRKDQVISKNTSKKLKEIKQESKPEKIKQMDKSTNRFRPRILPGITIRTNTPAGQCYITLNEDSEGLREVFIHASKTGSEIVSHVESEGRLISYALKHRLPAKGLIAHLDEHKSNPVWEGGRSIKSVPDAVAKCMKEYINNWEGFSKFFEDQVVAQKLEEKPSYEEEFSGDICSECGELLYREGGCETCKNCGYSRCG